MNSTTETKQLKIFYVCATNLSQNNAQSIHVVEVVNNLIKLKNKVTLFAPKIENSEISKINSELINIPLIKKHVLISYQPVLFLILLTKIIKYRPDIMYTRQEFFLIAPALICKIFAIPYIIEINGTMEEELKLTNWPSYAIKLHSFIENIACNQASKIIVVTMGLKDYLIAKYKIPSERINIVANGVNIDLFKPQNKIKMRNILGLNAKYSYIGYVGGIREWKGLNYIVTSIKRVIAKTPNTKLVIVGEGPEKENLEKLAKKLLLENNVIFTGDIKYSEVPRYVNAFDICLSYHTKQRAGFTSPFKIYEYLSCGKPTIVSDIKGVVSSFRNMVLVAKAEDSRDLANKINILIKNKRLSDELGKNGRSFILKNHSWKKVAERINLICLNTVQNFSK